MATVLLAFVTVIMVFFGVFTASHAKTAIHEIQAYLLFLISAVTFTGAFVITALERNHKAMNGVKEAVSLIGLKIGKQPEVNSETCPECGNKGVYVDIYSNPFCPHCKKNVKPYRYHHVRPPASKTENR